MLFLKATVLDVVDRLAAAYHHNQRRKAARNDLHRLNDRLLTDIGIERRQIPDVVDRMIGTASTEVYHDRQSGKQSSGSCLTEIAAPCTQS